MVLVIVGDPHMPAAVRILFQAGDGVPQPELESRMPRHRLDQLARQHPEIDVGAVLDLGGRDRLIRVAMFHHQRHPLAQHCGFLAVFHLLEQVMGVQRLVAFAQERDILLAPDEALVMDRIDEFLRRGQHALFDQIRPELQRHLVGRVDRQRAADIDAAVLPLRRVIQFAIAGMAGAGIVQPVRAFVRDLAQAFDHHDLQRRVQQRQQLAECRTHHARAHQQYVHFLKRHGRCFPWVNMRMLALAYILRKSDGISVVAR